MSTTNIIDECSNLKLYLYFCPSFEGIGQSLSRFLVHVNHLLESTHRFEVSGSIGGSSLTGSGDSFRSLASNRFFVNGFFAGREFSDLRSKSRNISFLDSFLLRVESTLDLGLDTLVGSFSRALEEIVGAQYGGLTILESKLGEALAGSKFNDTGRNGSLTEFRDIRERLALETVRNSSLLSVVDVLVNSVFHLVVSVDIERMSVKGDFILIIRELKIVDNESELNTTIGGENIL